MSQATDARWGSFRCGQDRMTPTKAVSAEISSPSGKGRQAGFVQGQDGNVMVHRGLAGSVDRDRIAGDEQIRCIAPDCVKRVCADAVAAFEFQSQPGVQIACAHQDFMANFPCIHVDERPGSSGVLPLKPPIVEGRVPRIAPVYVQSRRGRQITKPADRYVAVEHDHADCRARRSSDESGGVKVRASGAFPSKSYTSSA